jgi:uncharacterized protein
MEEVAQYIGFAFPFQRAASGFPAVATDNDLIKQSLLQIVLTGARERVMRPQFGSSVYDYIFEDDNALLQERISVDLSQLIGRFEPRVALLGITVVPGSSTDGTAQNTITVTISYIVLATQALDSTSITLTNPGP